MCAPVRMPSTASYLMFRMDHARTFYYASRRPHIQHADKHVLGMLSLKCLLHHRRYAQPQMPSLKCSSCPAHTFNMPRNMS